MKRSFPLVGLASSIFLIDQLSKNWALTQPGLLVSRNPGLFFGLLRGEDRVLMGTLVAMVVTQRVLRREENKAARVTLALVLGGAAGNLFDRLVRGYALDWLDLRILISFWPDDWPHHSNLADIFIAIGLFALMTSSLRRISARAKRKKAEPF